MAQTFDTSAIVLRSMRFSEADRILHLYTPELGKVSAIAKGARRAKSKLGALLEPFATTTLSLRAGRGDMYAINGAVSIRARAGLRSSAGALDAASRSCDAVSRMFDDAEAHVVVYNLLERELDLLASDGSAATWANQLAFRIKLTYAAGFTPQLGSCAVCGSGDDLVAFNPAAGGMVCASCVSGGFPFTEAAHDFMADALSKPLAEVPDPDEKTLVLVERAVSALLEHHAQVKLRPARVLDARSHATTAK